MRINKRFAALIGAVTLSAVCLTGCGGSSKSYADIDMYDMATEAPDAYYGYSSEINVMNGKADIEYEKTYSDEQAASAQINDTSERKLIKNVSLDIETLSFDEGCRLIEENIAKLGGYVESSSVYNDSYSYYNNSYRKNRSANYTLRVPRENLDAFVGAIGNIGNILNERSNTEDVTLTYLDVEARAKALRIQQERLLELLEKAETVEDIIALQDRISDVTYQLEAQESMLKNYDNLVSFSTVNLTVNEVQRVTVAEPETVGERIAAGLDNTFYDIKEGFKNFAVDFVVNLPFIIIWLAVLAILVFIVILIVKLCKKGHKKRMLKKQAAWAAKAANAQRNQPVQTQNTGYSEQK